jgi:hypothetical protein
MDYEEMLAGLIRDRVAHAEAERLDVQLWALVSGGQRAEARVRRHPVGLELAVTIDGVMASSSIFRNREIPLLEATSIRIREAMEATGWVVAGPAAAPPAEP